MSTPSMQVRPHLRDGIRDALADLAGSCDDGAKQLREARQQPQRDMVIALTNASIEAEQLFERLADRARRLRR